jgi:integrase
VSAAAAGATAGSTSAASPMTAGALLAAYAAHVQGLAISPDNRRVRLLAAERLLTGHGDLHGWMARPTPARLADLRRTGAWPFVTWCFVAGHLAPDLDLLLAKTPGGLYAAWAARHPDEVARITAVAHQFGWSATWTRDVSSGGLALLCLWTQKTLAQLTDADFADFAAELAAAPSATACARGHNSARLFSLHQACYELRICQRPPRRARPPAATLAERLGTIAQPEIRRVALGYLETVAATLQPGTVELRADSLIVFSEYLSAHHPEVTSLADLDRQAHIEPFLAWNRGRPWRGRLARDRPVSLVVSKHVVVDLRAFLDDLAIWGWAERPRGRLLFAGDVPRLDRPLPRALAPDVDRDLMAAVGHLDDPFARCGLTILRGTGMRLGELLDLELDCLWDSASHGTWIRVPLGKLGTQRTVPLDAETLAAIDAWMAIRGRQRALPHPRDGRLADFLFVERGRRLSDFRLRRGLRQAAAVAGLRGHDGGPLPVTLTSCPHLRHQPRQRRHEPAGADGAVGACLGRDDPAVCLPRLADDPGGLRGRDGEGAGAPVATADHRRQARGAGPGRMAPRRAAQDPGRARLLLAPPGRQGVPVCQRLRTVRQLRHHHRVPAAAGGATRRRPGATRRRSGTRLGLRGRPPRPGARQHRRSSAAAEEARRFWDPCLTRPGGPVNRDLPVDRAAQMPHPNDFPSLAAVQERLLAFQRRYEQAATPFQWKFTRADLAQLMKRLAADDDLPCTA